MATKQFKAGKQLSIPVQKKKGAKPAPKLIEGKYKQKFLVRLTPDESKLFEDVMKITNNKTMNGTVVYMAENYKNKIDFCESLQRENEKLKIQLEVNKEKLSNLKFALSEILD